MPNQFEYDLTNKESTPQSREIGKNDEKDVDISFTNLGFTRVTSTDYDYYIQLTPEKLAELEGWAIVLKDDDSSKVTYIITSTRFHYDATWEQYQSLPADMTQPGSEFVFFITDRNNFTISSSQVQSAPRGAIEEAILLIKEARDYIESQS